MKKHSRFRAILALFALAIPGLAFGGQCSPQRGTQSFAFSFNNTFTSPEESSRQTLMPNAHSWALGGKYAATCKCSKPESHFPGAIYLTTKTDLAKGYTATVNGTEMQFYKATRNLQVAAEVFVGGERNEYVPIPFTSVSNLQSEQRWCNFWGEFSSTSFNAGTQGHLHLMIDEPFIGESVIPRTKLFDMIGTLEQASPVGATPMADFWVSGSVVVPQSCQLAPGQLTTIDFGTLNPKELATLRETPQRSVSRTFNVQCRNLSEKVAVNLTLEGRPHPAERDTLEVNDRSDLVIVLKNNGRIVPPLSENSSPAPENRIPLIIDRGDQTAQFELEAYPVKMDKQVAPGEFTSQATVKFEFE